MSLVKMVFTISVYFAFTQQAGAFEPLKHPVRTLKFWGNYNKANLEEKILQKTPNELIDYLRKDNIKNGWPNIPKPADVPAQFLADLKEAINELPNDISKKINDKTIGLFFVSDLGGSAYTEYVLDEQGRQVAGFVVVDVSAMDRKANQWATWKESSAFKPEEDLKIEAIIAEPSNNNRKNAIQYILLHEFGHILSIGNPLVPAWGTEVKDMTIDSAMRFFNLSWKIHGNTFVTLFDSSWQNRAKIHYYVQPAKQVAASVALDAYNQLPKTNFPTLYAVTNPFDDFAESFVNYVHVVRLKKPWRVSVTSKTDSVRFDHCWNAVRCREKKTLIEEILRQ